MGKELQDGSGILMRENLPSKRGNREQHYVTLVVNPITIFQLVGIRHILVNSESVKDI